MLKYKQEIIFTIYELERETQKHLKKIKDKDHELTLMREKLEITKKYKKQVIPPNSVSPSRKNWSKNSPTLTNSRSTLMRKWTKTT